MPSPSRTKIRGTQSGVWALPPKTAEAAPALSSPSSSAIERRAFARHFCDFGSVVDSWPARIESISRGGLKVVIERRYEVGTVLKVEVAVPGGEGFAMSVVRVLRVAQESTGHWGLGCAFMQEISEEEMQELVTKEGC